MIDDILFNFFAVFPEGFYASVIAIGITAVIAAAINQWLNDDL